MEKFSEKCPVCPECNTVVTQFEINELMRTTKPDKTRCKNCGKELYFRRVEGFVTEII